MNKGLILVFSAASGAGKSTIISELKKRRSNMVHSISATTRAPRGTEKHGVDYFFYSVDQFKALIEQNEFVEWAQVHGNYYGTPRTFIDQQVAVGNIIVLDIDVQGKAQLDRVYPEAKGIFIEPPTWDVLEKRLRSRKTDSEEAIAVRLENARKEQDFARFEGKYDFFVVNDNLEEAVNKIDKIIEIVLR